MSNSFRLDIPNLTLVDCPHVRAAAYSNLPVFRAGCEEFSVWTETDTSNVEIASSISSVIKENTTVSYVESIGGTHQTFRPSFTS